MLQEVDSRRLADLIEGFIMERLKENPLPRQAQVAAKYPEARLPHPSPTFAASHWKKGG